MPHAPRRSATLSLAVAAGLLASAPAFGDGPAPSTRPAATPATRPAERPISAGERLQISVAGLESPASETVLRRTVGPDGTVALPLLAEPIEVAGRDADAARGAVVDAYDAAGIVRRAVARVHVERSADPALRTADDPIAAGELVAVTVVGLLAPGEPATVARRVGPSGEFGLPGAATVALVGRTPAEAERAVVDAYATAGVLRREGATVVVTRPDAGETAYPEARARHAAD